MKKFRKYLFWFSICILLSALIIIAVFSLSPKPGAWIIARAFNQEIKIQDTTSYIQSKGLVKTINNIRYVSRHKDNILDIYYPEDRRQVPVFFWVHGGGFVGGNNDGCREFATYIAAKCKIAVILVDYQKAPGLKYPGQILQLDEAVRFLIHQKKQYPFLDFSKIGLGGDSAGGLIAALYALIQSSPAYALQIKIPQTLPVTSIKAYIDYCAPVNIRQVLTQQSSSFFMRFFVRTVARAWLGERNWRSSPKILQASVADHLTAAFPPSFITDGNTGSFQQQATSFGQRLQALNVPTDILLFNQTKKEITHEYQFAYSTPEAKRCLALTLAFINRNFNQPTR